MRRINKDRLVKGLTADELNRIVAWYAESYDAGWRPQTWSPRTAGDLRARVDELERQQAVGDGDTPWV